MANYAITNSTVNGYGNLQAAMTTTYKTILTVGVGSSVSASGFPSGGAVSPYNPRRGKIYDLLVGTNGTPADNAMIWDVSRIGAAGMLSSQAYTGALSSVSSAFALDAADGLTAAWIVANSTTETSTYAISLWNVGVNQRASYRWVAAPGSELVYAATSSAGLGLRAQSPGYTGTVTGTLYFQEQ